MKLCSCRKQTYTGGVNCRHILSLAGCKNQLGKN
ncbi:MAG: hypothetical protein EU530_07215 [Promethearchaeota archaeon]|nr:MAG: hypothetical protein EU530_07215 [Candidatus Lokiarchaeota archaeon]